MRRILFGILVTVFILTGIFTGCNFETLSHESGFLVSGINNQRSRSLMSNTSRDVAPIFELWMMPTRRGVNEPISHTNMYDLKKFSMLEDGSYLIPLEEFPDSTSVVFIVDTSSTPDFEVVGFLSLKIDEDHSVIEFPPRDEITGTVEFGEVRLDDLEGYIAESSYTLDDNESAFSVRSFDQLQQDVVFHNSSLIAVNILNNTDLESGNYYAFTVIINYSTILDAVIDDSSDIPWGSIGINIYSYDHSSKASLFTPNGLNLKGSGVFSSAYGPQSSVQWSFSIPLSTFRQYAQPKSMWQLRDDSGRVLAEFDLSVAMLTDDHGYPIIPIAAPTAVTKPSDDSLVDSISFNWFYFDTDGSTKYLLNDSVMLDRMIGKQEFHIQMNQSDILDRTVTYMYDRVSDGMSCGSMEGDIATATNFEPYIPISRFNGPFDLGYRFTLYNCRTQW